MFHSDHSILQVLGHVLVATFYLVIGIRNLAISGNHVEKFRKLGIPYPATFLGLGYAFQFCGAILILIDFHAGIGAILLIVFTIMANLLYHRWWLMSDALQSRNHMNLFFNNVGNMGGLVLLLHLS